MDQKLRTAAAGALVCALLWGQMLPVWAASTKAAVSTEETTAISQTEPTAETVPTLPSEPEKPSEETIPGETEDLPSPEEPEGSEPLMSHGIPLYFQTDYPNVPFSGGTLAQKGSSVASLAMVASQLTGETLLPDELAKQMLKNIGEDQIWLEAASDALGLSWQRAEDRDEAVRGLKDGKLVIALLNEDSVFANPEHFVVLAGITEEGAILVNDPCKDDYSREELSQPLLEGFEQKALSAGWSAAWIYEPVQEEPQPEEAEETVPAEAAAEETQPEETVPQETEEEWILPLTIEIEGESSQTETAEEPAAQALTDRPEVKASTVPLFWQTDYPDVPYDTGTVATSGCGITALAMVATYMTDHPYLPDELAGYFGGSIKGVCTLVQRLEYATNALQLPYTKARTVYDALDAVKEGKVVIALVNENSLFTSSQHFVVLTGTTEDGKFLVNDPNEANYNQKRLEEPFRTGFTQSQINRGFSGGWIFDKSVMPDDPFIYTGES